MQTVFIYAKDYNPTDVLKMSRELPEKIFARINQDGVVLSSYLAGKKVPFKKYSKE